MKSTMENEMNREQEIMELLDTARDTGDDDSLCLLEAEMDRITGLKLGTLYDDMLEFESWMEHFHSTPISRRGNLKEI